MEETYKTIDYERQNLSASANLTASAEPVSVGMKRQR